MADLSSLFGASINQQRQPPPLFGSGQQAARFKRQMVLREAQAQGLRPEDGEAFFNFASGRLLQLGDAEGGFALAEQGQAILGARAAGQQQQFDNGLAAERLNLERSADRRAERKQRREASRVKPPTTRELKVGDQIITQRFNEATGAFEDIPGAVAPRFNDAPLVQIGGEAQKIRTKLETTAQVEDELTQQKTTPIINQYLDAIRRVAEEPTPENIAVAQTLQNIAGQALARKRNPQRVTDDDVKQAIDALPTPASLTNFASFGGALEAQIEAFRKAEGVEPEGGADKEAIGKALGIDPSRITNIRIVPN